MKIITSFCPLFSSSSRANRLHKFMKLLLFGKFSGSSGLGKNMHSEHSAVNIGFRYLPRPLAGGGKGERRGSVIMPKLKFEFDKEGRKERVKL